MEWKVYTEDFNQKKIVTVNVFEYVSYKREIDKLYKKKLSKEEFSEELRKITMYRFWSKAEHEVIITSWPPHITNEELARLSDEQTSKYQRLCPRLEVREKIDIYDQLMLNWNVFVNYVYNKGEI